MNTLYININGDDIKGTENMAVVGKPEDAVINKFYYELVKGIVKGVTVPGIGEVKKKNLVTDFEAINAKAFAEITEQWDLVKQALLGENPDGTFTVTLPQEYVEWLYYHANPVCQKVAESLASRGNAVEVNIGNIYRNGLLLLVNNIDTNKEYGQFVVSDALVDDESAIVVAIRKKIGDDVPFVPFVDFEVPVNGDTPGSISGNGQQKPPKGGEVGKNDLVFEIGNVQFVMKKVEGGTFFMGAQDDVPYEPNYAPEAESDESPVHSVTLSSFYLGETEVTQALWEALMGEKRNRSSFDGDSNLPVESVSWEDICGIDGKAKDPNCFLYRLNHLTGKNFRLPTEAEWEYAARGGNHSNKTKFAGSNNIESVAWYGDNSDGVTHVVKGKSPNELGLYDMSGNVWEWCGDRYGDYGSGSRTNPKGTDDGSRRVLRGGGWNSIAGRCRVSYRNNSDPDDGNDDIGFRLCLPQ